jgi:hypothetical protein
MRDVRRKDVDRLSRNCAWQMFERHECANLEVQNICHLAEYLAARDLFPGSPDTAYDHAGKRCPDVGAPQQVIDLTNADPRYVRIADRQVAICFRLLDFKFGNEARITQLTLAPQLAVELANVDLRSFEERLLFGTLQQQCAFVDAGDGFAFLYDSAWFGDHDELPGDARRDLRLVTAIDGSRDGHGRQAVVARTTTMQPTTARWQWLVST